MNLRTDESSWPLVVTTWPPVLTDAELGRFLARVDVLFARGTPWVHVIDAREATRAAATPRMRAAAVAFTESLPAERAALLVGECFVITSAPVRGVLTALTWMFRPVWPREMVATMGEGERWARARLEAAASPAPRRAV